MSFLGNPCACGWSLTDSKDGLTRSCKLCLRTYIYLGWGWSQTTPLNQVSYVPLCSHGKVALSCRYCVKMIKNIDFEYFSKQLYKICLTKDTTTLEILKWSLGDEDGVIVLPAQNTSNASKFG